MLRALALCCLAGCGYRLVPPGGGLPAGVSQVDVRLLGNRTPEVNVDALVTRALAAHYARAGQLDERAEAVVSGTILAVGAAPLLASAAGRPQPTYRLTLTAELTLTAPSAAPVRVTVSEGEDYHAGPDILTTEASRGAALRRLAEVVARRGAELLAGAR